MRTAHCQPTERTSTRPRGARAPGRALVLAVCAVAAIAIGLGPALDATSGENLDHLQRSQSYNSTDEKSNLRLEPVDFSSRESVVEKFARRFGASAASALVESALRISAIGIR